MTDFKITPEDVGRVAVDERGYQHEILHVTDWEACTRCVDGLYIYNLSGRPEDRDNDNLTHWHSPESIGAPS